MTARSNYLSRLFHISKVDFKKAYPAISVHHRDFPRRRAIELLDTDEARRDLQALKARFPVDIICKYFAYYLHIEVGQVPSLIPSLNQ